jgi:hypothetical protein
MARRKNVCRSAAGNIRPFHSNVQILTDGCTLDHVVVLEAVRFILINLSNA